MAEVSADDVTLSYTGSTPYIVLVQTTIDDDAGNNNGRLDPGETIDLTATIRNAGGVNFTNVSSHLISTDPYINITDNTGVFGALMIDSVKTNNSDPFTLTCNASTPEGHEASFGLVINDGSYYDTLEFIIVAGHYSYLVLNLDATPQSGNNIDSILDALGYSGTVTASLPSDLSIYRTLFVCLGIYPNNTVVSAGGEIANSIVAFLNNGGSVYMEGGDMWYYDIGTGGHDFGPMFGIQPVADGSGNLGPVVGISGTFTATMNFNYGGENSYIDQINATGTGTVIFSDGNDNYNCGVANQTSTYRTVGTSFELGMLTDAADASTRSDLLDSIMTFFLEGLNAVAEQPVVNPSPTSLMITPNPFVKHVTISFTAPSGVTSGMEIFDISGRIVREFSFGQSENDRIVTVNWDGKDGNGIEVPEGVYFVNVIAGESSGSEKLILVK
ncbi:T9SS type A sorting domain-containing protein [candidate division WOR-3 bacterium]|nr:T9SS type A sorting domain-containing protein [candidate division WOR-3 bacterium]